METNEKKENGTPFEFLDKIPDTECGIYVPAECESCGKKILRFATLVRYYFLR